MLPYLIAGVIGYGISKLFDDKKAPKYTDGGLIAPNGKPSNLTPEQYKLVRTKAFKKWFGDWESKQFKNNHNPHSEIYPYDTIALDENGEPRIWHRATNYEYTEFDTEYIYLGSKKSYVKQYGKPKEFFIKPKKTIFIDNEDIERQKLGIKFDYLAEYITDENGIPRKGKNYEKLKKAFENQKEVLSVWEYFTLVGNKEILDLLKNWFDEYGFDSVMYWETGLKNNFGKYPVGLICLYFGNQIKLADGTNTTFDGNNPDIRYVKGGEIKDLIVLHNINEYQIKEANKLGGLVTPSIAIIKSGNSFTDFGSITLVGTKELIDPENRSVKVFAGDVYSPSVPRKLYYVDKRLLEKITNELIKKAHKYDDTISKSDREIYHLVYYAIGSHTSFEEDINRMSFNELLDYYYDKLKIVYIVDKSIKIKVPMKAKRTFLWNNVEFTLTDEQIKRFAPILREYTKQSNENGSNGVSKEIKSQVYDLFLEVLENIKQKIKQKYYDKGEQRDIFYKIMMDEIDKSFEKYVGTRYDWSGHTEYKLSKAVWGEKELDKEKLNQNIKKVFTKNVNEDYKEWLSDFISQFQGSSYFLKGNEKMPYTLNYLVDATSNKIVGQEKNMTFGVNQAKSFGTKRLNSIDEIKKNSNKIITKEEMNVVDDKNKDNFFKLSQSLNFQYDTWNKLDSLGKALADYFKGTSIVSALRKNDFKSPSSYQITLFKDFADELKNSPVDYFEAKYQRAVSLSEFKYAIVPKDTSKEIIEILKKNGLIVKKYENDEERLEVINKISEKDKSIKFNDGGSVLLAPNGKPSNLTPKQYKLVRTPAFKEWFGDWEKDPENASKVVDENGEPMVCYHGTYISNKKINGAYTELNTSTYFTDQKFTAEKYPIGDYVFYNSMNDLEDDLGDDYTDYINDNFDIDESKGIMFSADAQNVWENFEFENIHIYECFLDIKNPKMYYHFSENEYEFQDLYKDSPIINQFKNEGYDGLIKIYEARWFTKDWADLNEGKKSDYEKEKHFVIFNSNQIKLADGSNTTFDSNNPDIRFDGGGAINKSNDFIGTWEELKKYNPNLFKTGILRRSQNPQGANDIIPKDVFIRQYQWQNYGQYDEIDAETIYGEPDNYDYYNDEYGNPITDERTGNYLRDEYDYENNAERIKATISNKQLKNNLIDSFQTEEGKYYLQKVIANLPKNVDGTITAYRIGTINKGIQSYTLSEGMAKTFSNQGTDIMPSGLPSIPTEGYKEYGVLPVNKVKINPKGIVAWSPYDSEILVEPKYIKTY